MVSCIFIFHIILHIITNASNALLKMLHFGLEVISLHDVSLPYLEQIRDLKSEFKIEYQHHLFRIKKIYIRFNITVNTFSISSSLYIINHSGYEDGFLFIPKYISFRGYFHSYNKSNLILIFIYHSMAFIKFL